MRNLRLAPSPSCHTHSLELEGVFPTLRVITNDDNGAAAKDFQSFVLLDSREHPDHHRTLTTPAARSSDRMSLYAHV